MESSQWNRSSAWRGTHRIRLMAMELVDKSSSLWALVPCALLLFKCPQSSDESISRIQAIDWLGTITILGMSLMTLLGLNLGGIVSPWASPKVICLMAFGFLTSILFVLYEAKVAKSPLMPMRVLRNRSNIASLLVCFMHGFVSSNTQFFETSTYVN